MYDSKKAEAEAERRWDKRGFSRKQKDNMLRQARRFKINQDKKSEIKAYSDPIFGNRSKVDEVCDELSVERALKDVWE